MINNRKMAFTTGPAKQTRCCACQMRVIINWRCQSDPGLSAAPGWFDLFNAICWGRKFIIIRNCIPYSSLMLGTVRFCLNRACGKTWMYSLGKTIWSYREILLNHNLFYISVIRQWDEHTRPHTENAQEIIWSINKQVKYNINMLSKWTGCLFIYLTSLY